MEKTTILTFNALRAIIQNPIANFAGNAVVWPLKTIINHPRKSIVMLFGIAGARSIINLYMRLYGRFVNQFEFVPPNDEMHIMLRFIRNTLRFTAARWRYYFMTLGGYFPPNVQYYSALMEKSTIRKGDLRPTFVPAGDTIDIISCHSIHSHPKSAEFRSSANQYLTEMVRRAGYDPYSVSSSRRDDGDGNRFFYCSKDFGMKHKNDPVGENSALIFTDVDYYADMPRWLNLWKPICMYTLSPDRLNFNNEEYSFQCKGNVLHYNVSGGGRYNHQLWDYKGDTVTAIDYDGNLLVYDIEQRKIQGDEQHRLVWLLPKAKITDPLWISVYFDWCDNLLSRKVMMDGNLQYLWEPISDSLSIGEYGSNYSVTMSGKLYEAIRTRLQNKESTVFVSDVERMLKEAKHCDYVKDAPILYKCFGEQIAIKPNVIKTGAFPTVYLSIPKKGALSTEDSKMPGQVVTTPLTSQPAIFAAKGHNADRACIEGRIDAVRNSKRFSPKYKRYADEFVRRLVPQHLVGTGVPLSIGEVRETQTKRLQIGRFNQVAPMMSTNVENKIKAEIKTETYGAAKPPRNISTMTPEITIQSSAFSLPMAKVLKIHQWYCPGKKPKEIVAALDRVLQMEPEHAIEEGDYTCLDGTQSADYSNYLLLPMYMRYYAPEHRAEFRRLYKQIYKNQASTTTGFSYKPEMTVRSGSSITTQSGTLDNAFNVYCALRQMGYSEEEAWHLIGAIFGDDSVNANHRGVFTNFIAQVARDLGMLYKSNLRARGEPVLFLGRYFVDPTTSNDSFADPMRTIGKLHASANKTVSQEQGAANKAHGYITTDLMTPVIGTWAQRVIKITGLKFKNGTGEEQHKCSNAWPQRDRVAIRDSMAKVLNIDVEELIRKDKLIESVNGLDQFPVIFDTEYNHTQLAVVDGQLIGTDLHQIEENGTHGQPTSSNPSLQQNGAANANGASDAIKRPANCTSGSRKTPTQRRTQRSRRPRRILPTSRTSSGKSAKPSTPRTSGTRN